MDIITSTELCALKMEKDREETKAESLRQNVIKILNKEHTRKRKSNLPQSQQKALKELKSMEEVKVYPFAKGNGFVLLNADDAITKIENQIGKSKIIDIDPTPQLVSKFQKILCKMRKEGKFDDRTYFKIYPSDAIPPRLYGTVKAHKPEKNYPMRTVVSTIGTPQYGVSEYLVKIIQPTLNKHPHRIVNSTSFVNEAKEWDIDPDEVQVSYDAVNLYPSVPIDKAIDVIVEILNNDIDDLKTRTKLSLVDIHKLLDLCLSICYFLFENRIRKIDNAGPIGLSLMVVIAEGYLQFIEKRALQKALITNLAPKSYKRYVDDTHSRFRNQPMSEKFLDILNEQDPAIQFTIEHQHDGTLNFLDTTIINNKSGKYEFKVFRKDAITNVQVKPDSGIDPKIIDGIFKGFLIRAKRICSEKYLNQEIDFLLNMFVENGHDRKSLQKIIANLNKPRIQNDNENIHDNFIKMPWVPRIGPKLRKIYKKQGFKIAFSSGRNLKEILCNNKSKLLPNSFPGVYQLDCSCGGVYIGETKKKVLTRSIEHQVDSMNGNWSASGATEHTKSCHGHFDWLHPKTLCICSNYHERKVREALEINKMAIKCEKLKSIKILNRDNGANTSIRSWKPVIDKYLDFGVKYRDIDVTAV